MAGLMQRASLVVKAKFSKLLNRAENPTETLDYSYEQMLQQLQNVKRGVADVVTAKKRLELQTQSIEQNVVKLGEAATGIGRGMKDTGMAIQRAKDKTEELQARASAIDELTASGALEDIGDNRTQLDRELAKISATSQVDDELAKLKAEVGP